jgi:hypothetical protein
MIRRCRCATARASWAQRPGMRPGTRCVITAVIWQDRLRRQGPSWADTARHVPSAFRLSGNPADGPPLGRHQGSRRGGARIARHQRHVMGSAVVTPSHGRLMVGIVLILAAPLPGPVSSGRLAACIVTGSPACRLLAGLIPGQTPATWPSSASPNRGTSPVSDRLSAETLVPLRDGFRQVAAMSGGARPGTAHTLP